MHSLGSLKLATAGTRGAGCASGNECLWSRSVPGRGPSLEPWLLAHLLRLSCALSSQVDGQHLWLPVPGLSAKNQLLGHVLELPVQVRV